MNAKKLVSIFFIAILVALSGGATGCKVQKNDFHKKKWKIKKGHPPVQRYYNKWSPFNPHRK
ncbi:hypothetical protein [Sanyastnella coralliicola]|uniref:hypothetical protein n=1 Tax=Sanyastnella coralliicola TaxID=3069118 RepID=UPI0027BAB638|nr:hypothetical protein [Longitalea sp. SCSIO 12813]